MASACVNSYSRSDIINKRNNKQSGSVIVTIWHIFGAKKIKNLRYFENLGSNCVHSAALFGLSDEQ